MLTVTKLCRLFAGVFLLAFPIYNAFGQHSFGGMPESFNLGIKSAPLEISMPFVSADSLRKSDSIETLKGRKTYRFAKAFEVNFTPQNSGTWITSEKGTRVWRLAIYSKDAYSIGISFRDFYPVPGSRIYIFNPEHTEILGAFTSDNITPGECLITYPIPSDHVIVEYDLPAGQAQTGGFTIGLVAHDYKNAFGKNASSELNSQISGSCNVDINCAAGANWQAEKRSVCKLLINGITLCTGTLVNNVRQDGKAFLLTASHCVPLSNTAYNTLVIFNYEKDSCAGNTVTSHPSISGMWLRATTEQIDFSLNELGERPPISFNAYLAGWNIDETGITNETTIHHPEGDVKKISYCSTPVVTDDFGSPYNYMTHWRVNRWNFGDTEPGSSGSPLFDQNHYIIGTLTGGISSCADPDSDYFQKISHSWADSSAPSMQLKYWLDPDNTNAHKLQGMNPYNYSFGNCITNTNILPSETPVNPATLSAGGYYAGQNGLGFTLFAERFITSDSIKINTVIFNIAALVSGINSSINLKIWKGGIVPGTLIYTQNILYKTLTSNVHNNIILDKLLQIKDTFFVGFEINYTTGDKIALFIAPDRLNAAANTAFAYVGTAWTPFTSISSYAFLSTSLDIGIKSCDLISDSFSEKTDSARLMVYPNPGKGIFVIRTADGLLTESVSVFDLGGRKMENLKIWKEGLEISIDLTNTCPGMYIVRGASKYKMWTGKLLKL